MFVCLFVRPLAYLENQTSIFREISTRICVTYGRGLVLQGRQCNRLYTSSFVDDVMFSHNGPNRSESKTTRVFRPVRQVAAPGAKSPVSDCILLSIGPSALGPWWSETPIPYTLFFSVSASVLH